MNKVESIAMQLITFAGSAKSAAVEAIQAIKAGNVEESDALMLEAKETLKEGSRVHFEAIQISDSDEFEVSLLLVHAEDQLLTTETLLIFAKEIIELWKNK